MSMARRTTTSRACSASALAAWRLLWYAPLAFGLFDASHYCPVPCSEDRLGSALWWLLLGLTSVTHTEHAQHRVCSNAQYECDSPYIACISASLQHAHVKAALLLVALHFASQWRLRCPHLCTYDYPEQNDDPQDS